MNSPVFIAFVETSPHPLSPRMGISATSCGNFHVEPLIPMDVYKCHVACSVIGHQMVAILLLLYRRHTSKKWLFSMNIYTTTDCASLQLTQEVCYSKYRPQYAAKKLCGNEKGYILSHYTSAVTVLIKPRLLSQSDPGSSWVGLRTSCLHGILWSCDNSDTGRAQHTLQAGSGPKNRSSLDRLTQSEVTVR